jgi:hypothetical protein
MTPPIGFRTDNTNDPQGTLMEIRTPAALRDAAPEVPSPSRVSDYVYRIAALTAGIALLASIW